MPDVEPGPRVGRDERSRLDARRDVATLPRNYWDFATIRDAIVEAEAGDAGHDAGAPRAAGRRSAAA